MVSSLKNAGRRALRSRSRSFCPGPGLLGRPPSSSPHGHSSRRTRDRLGITAGTYRCNIADDVGAGEAVGEPWGSVFSATHAPQTARHLGDRRHGRRRDRCDDAAKPCALELSLSSPIAPSPTPRTRSPYARMATRRAPLAVSRASGRQRGGQRIAACPPRQRLSTISASTTLCPALPAPVAFEPVGQWWVPLGVRPSCPTAWPASRRRRSPADLA